MLTKYIEAALKQAEYKILDDGTFWGEIPGFEGVWADEASLDACCEELRSVLEDWLVFKLRLGDEDLPVPGKLSLNPRKAARRGTAVATSVRKAS